MAVTVQLPILSVKKNPQNPLYTQLGVLTKGTIIEVNVSELGMVTTSGKVVWGPAEAEAEAAPDETGEPHSLGGLYNRVYITDCTPAYLYRNW